MRQKRILYILKHDPWGVGGGSYACLMYLTAFRKLFSTYQMDVLICDNCMRHQPVEWKNRCNFIPIPPRRLLSRYFSCITGIMHRYQKVAKEKLQSNDYEYCIFDHNQIAGTLIDYVNSATKTIVIHHNVERHYTADNSTSNLYKILILPQVIRCERNAYTKCDYNIFLTEEDMTEFHSLYGECKGYCSAVGLFETIDSPKIHYTNQTQSPVIVISGSLCNVQNTDGIMYFIRELYPYIPNNIPVIIAGKNPLPAIINALKDLPNVKLVSNPENMNDIINQASIYVCPTRLGSGIKVRISDGLKNGLPVIAHNVSARGYSDYIKKGCFFSFSNPKEFQEAFDIVLKRQKDGLWNEKDIIEIYYSISSLEAGCQRLKDFLFKR